MKTEQQNHAVPVTLCDHLMERGLEQPFTLMRQTGAALYLCPLCLGIEVVGHLEDGDSPEDVKESLSFDLCDHGPKVTGRGHPFCIVCLRAILGGLAIEWATYSLTNKPLANRIKSVSDKLEMRFDVRGALVPETTPKDKATAKVRAAKTAKAVRKAFYGGKWQPSAAPEYPKPAIQSTPLSDVIVIPPGPKVSSR
jgi:hypothetical protein